VDLKLYNFCIGFLPTETQDISDKSKERTDSSSTKPNTESREYASDFEHQFQPYSRWEMLMACGKHPDPRNKKQPRSPNMKGTICNVQKLSQNCIYARTEK
jgi:hypothetical protein